MTGCCLPIEKIAHYSIHPFDPALNEKEQKVALLWAIGIGSFSCGLFPLGSYLYEKRKSCRQEDPEKSCLLCKVDTKVTTLTSCILNGSYVSNTAPSSAEEALESNSLLFTLSLPAQDEVTSSSLLCEASFLELNEDIKQSCLELFLMKKCVWSDVESEQADVVRQSFKQSLAYFMYKAAEIYKESSHPLFQPALVGGEVHVSPVHYYETLYKVQQSFDMFYVLLKYSPFSEDQELAYLLLLVAILGKEEFKKAIPQEEIPVIVLKRNLDFCVEDLKRHKPLAIANAYSSELEKVREIVYLNAFYTLFEEKKKSLKGMHHLFISLIDPATTLQYAILKESIYIDCNALNIASLLGRYFFKDLYARAFTDALNSKILWLLINIMAGNDQAKKINFFDVEKPLEKIFILKNGSSGKSLKREGIEFLLTCPPIVETSNLIELKFDQVTDDFIAHCFNIYCNQKESWTPDDVNQINVIRTILLNSLAEYLKLADEVFESLNLSGSEINYSKETFFASPYAIFESKMKLHKLAGNYYKLLKFSPFIEDEKILNMLELIALVGSKRYFEQIDIFAYSPEIIPKPSENGFELKDLNIFHAEVSRINLKNVDDRQKSLIRSFDDGFYNLLITYLPKLERLRTFLCFLIPKAELSHKIFILEDAIEVSEKTLKNLNFICQHVFYDLFSLAYKPKLRRAVSWLTLYLLLGERQIRKINIPINECIFRLASLKERKLTFQREEEHMLRQERNTGNRKHVASFDRELLGSPEERLESSRKWLETGLKMYKYENSIYTFKQLKTAVDIQVDLVSQIRFLSAVNFNKSSSLPCFTQATFVSTFKCELLTQCIKKVTINIFEEICFSPYVESQGIDKLNYLFRCDSGYDVMVNIKKIYMNLFRILNIFLADPQTDQDSLVSFRDMYARYSFMGRCMEEIATHNTEMFLYLEKHKKIINSLKVAADEYL